MAHAPIPFNADVAGLVSAMLPGLPPVQVAAIEYICQQSNTNWAEVKVNLPYSMNKTVKAQMNNIIAKANHCVAPKDPLLLEAGLNVSVLGKHLLDETSRVYLQVKDVVRNYIIRKHDESATSSDDDRARQYL